VNLSYFQLQPLKFTLTEYAAGLQCLLLLDVTCRWLPDHRTDFEYLDSYEDDGARFHKGEGEGGEGAPK
jgi:hypothetical protein